MRSNSVYCVSLLVGIAGSALVTAQAAFGQASMQGGTLEVASSWKGTPIYGYSDVHGHDLVTHGPTTSAIAYSSLPLSLAHSYAYDYNANGYRLENQMGINWGSEGHSGTWDFTFESTQEEWFTLSTAVDWVSTVHSNSTIPFSYFWLDDMTNGGPSIDLMTVHSGTLPAGDYRWRCHAQGEWTTSDQTFLHMNTMRIEFSIVPAPGAVSIAAAAGLLLARRRRP